LLRGDAGTLIVRYCDGVATARFCSVTSICADGFFRLRKTFRNDLSQAEITPFKARRNVIQLLRPSSF